MNTKAVYKLSVTADATALRVAIILESDKVVSMHRMFTREVKPSVSKFTEWVVSELSTELVDAEVQIGLVKERKEGLESEGNVLKRKQEALESTCVV